MYKSAAPIPNDDGSIPAKAADKGMVVFIVGANTNQRAFFWKVIKELCHRCSSSTAPLVFSPLVWEMWAITFKTCGRMLKKSARNGVVSIWKLFGTAL